MMMMALTNHTKTNTKKYPQPTHSLTHSLALTLKKHSWKFCSKLRLAKIFSHDQTQRNCKCGPHSDDGNNCLLSEHIFAQEKANSWRRPTRERKIAAAAAAAAAKDCWYAEDAEQHNKSATRVLVPVANANYHCRPVISLSYWQPPGIIFVWATSPFGPAAPVIKTQSSWFPGRLSKKSGHNRWLCMRVGYPKTWGFNRWLCIRVGYEITGSSLPGILSVFGWL